MVIISPSTAPKTTGKVSGGGAKSYVLCITMKEVECGYNHHATILT